MKFPALLASDLHLTANPLDEYRWGLFGWLREQCVTWEIQTLCILGDLTDAKDYHSAELVNRVVREIVRLKECVPRLIILMGNHDYLRSGHAFFGFLSSIPGVTFAASILDTSSEGEPCLFLPHTKNPAKDWAGLDFSHYRFLFMHQTVTGSKASNGQTMNGEALPDLSVAGKVWSGDIHVPQHVGPVEYVGSPYHVHFGDSFKPRCVVIQSRGRREDLTFPTISRFTLAVSGLAELGRLKFRAGDQVKLRLALARADMHQWAAIKRDSTDYLRGLGVEVCGVELVAPKTRNRVQTADQPRAARRAMTPEDIVSEFVRREDLGADALDAALEALL
jgi:hypothetical protein